MECREHRVEARTDACEHRGLVERYVGETFAEGIDRSQVARTTFDEELVERILGGWRELERIVLNRLDARDRKTEAVLDLGARPQHLDETLYRNTHDLLEHLVIGKVGAGTLCGAAAERGKWINCA